MGKTIEAILMLRRLMAGRGVQRVLFLLPAGILKQWQEELREKGGLLFPRLEGATTYERGLLADPPPRRSVEDVVFEHADPAERGVYNAVGQYIAKRYDELEQEKPGKGFVMTIYRRRASSAPLAIERSLERRRDGLLQVAQRRAHDFDLSSQDVPDAVDRDDLPEGEGASSVSAALPSDPQIARAELTEVERVLDMLHALHGRDILRTATNETFHLLSLRAKRSNLVVATMRLLRPLRCAQGFGSRAPRNDNNKSLITDRLQYSKRDCFFDVLRRITEDGRPVLVFTEYVDTLEYLRDCLMAHYSKSLGCYSGEGGQLWDGQDWKAVTKDVITAALRAGKLRVLIYTDAASEGLNLQAAAAVINYDLPWNPSKIEQRIGRVDRIGQRWPTVLVVNLFLKDSVDDRVYRVLRARCGLFERFVGAMQPVLARARRMLLGQDLPDLQALDTAAHQVETDPVAGQTYLESPADTAAEVGVSLNRQKIEAALRYLNGGFGVRVDSESLAGTHVIAGPGSAVLDSQKDFETIHETLRATQKRCRACGTL